jgi:4'-phosphopantetheinyl transferase
VSLLPAIATIHAMTTEAVRAHARRAGAGADLARSLGDRDVHVWIVPLAMGLQGDEALPDVLSPAELTTMARFASADDRRRYALSHVAARRILAAYVDRDPADLRFQQDRTGKPHLTDTDVQHSLAHAGRLALVGVGRHRALGVDAERVRPLPAADALKRSCLTARERLHVDAAGTEEALLRLWTRKEAVVKATGEGLSRALDGFEVLAACTLPGWRVVDLAPAAGYVGAAVVSDDVTKVIAVTVSDPDRPAPTLPPPAEPARAPRDRSGGHGSTPP